MIRQYHINAVQSRITYNKHGDYDPDGLRFVLKKEESRGKYRTDDMNANETLQTEEQKNETLQTQEQKEEIVEGVMPEVVEEVYPLVLRACQGDTVKLVFTNKLPYTVFIDFDECRKQVDPGASVAHVLRAVLQGVHLYKGSSCTDLAESTECSHGLFGALIIEAPGATWTHPETGQNLESGVSATIHNWCLPDFREFVLFFHGEIPLKNELGDVPCNPLTGLPDYTFGINYRSEPFRNRLKQLESGKIEGVSEEVFYDSWAFGDPATPVFRAYAGDPVRFYLINLSSDTSHAFHLHGHSFRVLGSENEKENNLPDTIFLEPLQTVVIDLMHGAGGFLNAIGDYLFNCCLYSHCEEGTWGILRVLDTLENGKNRCYPDGTRIPALFPLSDRNIPPEPTRKRPGFPLFIPGKVGKRAPLPPYDFNRSFRITDLERHALSHIEKRKKSDITRQIDIVAMEMPICYNRAEWFDPQGRVFVLAEDEKSVRLGMKNIEPLIIRANAGECIEIRLINKLPDAIGGTPFQLREETPYCSIYARGVGLDVLTSDGSNCGWNYFCGVESGKKGVYRWYAASASTSLFYDHLFLRSNQNHGLFGALIVEARGSRYTSPFTGQLLQSGSHAVIENPYLPDFREYCLIANGFAPLFDKDMTCINPPEVPNHLYEHGVFSYNYKNEPLWLRPGEPAYVLSSWVHGDPQTPVFQGYTGDPVKFYYINLQNTETIDIHAHTYNQNHKMFVNETAFRSDSTFIRGPLMFTLAENDDDFDVLYRAKRFKDFKDGLWGLIRVRGKRVPFLKPLGDKKPLPGRVLPFPAPTGRPPKQPLYPGKFTADGSVVRKYHVAAIQHPIVYNSHNDHDPFAVLFVPKDRVEHIYADRFDPEPLIIRANVGDCIELTLTNLLPGVMPEYSHFSRADASFPRLSSRVSLHAAGLKYDILGSDGATVGFNPDQTIAPGETITYRWHVETIPDGVLELCDYGNIFNHEHHGLFGALTVQPMGSCWKDRHKKGKIRTTTEVDIFNPFIPAFREVVLIQHDCGFLIDKDGRLVSHLFEDEENNMLLRLYSEESERGVRAINYRSEPSLACSVKKNKSLICWNDVLEFILTHYSAKPVVVRWLERTSESRKRSYYVIR